MGREFMVNIRHEEADDKEFYTYHDYLKDKASGHNKDSFAYNYWENTEDFINERKLYGRYERERITDGSSNSYSEDLQSSVNNYFYCLRVAQDKAAMNYLEEHDLVIDQWPDPCLPVIWRPETNHDKRFGAHDKKLLFKDKNDGFCFHFFGGEYVYKEYSSLFCRPQEAQLYDLHKNDPNVYDKKLREKNFRDRPISRLKDYQKQILYLPEQQKYSDASKKLKKIHKDMENDQESIERVSFGNRFIWTLLMLIGTVCISLVVLCAYWFLKGMDTDMVNQSLLAMAEADNSKWSIKLVFLTVGYFIYVILSLAVAIGGTVGFWVGEGILLLLIAILVLYIAVRLDAKKSPLGKRAREGRKKAAEWNVKLEEARKELKKAEKELQEAENALKSTDGYLQAVQRQKWWVNNYYTISNKWMNAWYQCFLNRTKPAHLPPLEVRKHYEERIILETDR